MLSQCYHYGTHGFPKNSQFGPAVWPAIANRYIYIYIYIQIYKHERRALLYRRSIIKLHTFITQLLYN